MINNFDDITPSDFLDLADRHIVTDYEFWEKYLPILGRATIGTYLALRAMAKKSQFHKYDPQTRAISFKPTFKEIQAFMGVHQDTLIKDFNKLEKIDLLEVERAESTEAGNKTPVNKYTLFEPPTTGRGTKEATLKNRVAPENRVGFESPVIATPKTVVGKVEVNKGVSEKPLHFTESSSSSSLKLYKNYYYHRKQDDPLFPILDQFFEKNPNISVEEFEIFFVECLKKFEGNELLAKNYLAEKLLVVTEHKQAVSPKKVLWRAIERNWKPNKENLPVVGEVKPKVKEKSYSERMKEEYKKIEKENDEAREVRKKSSVDEIILYFNSLPQFFELEKKIQFVRNWYPGNPNLEEAIIKIRKVGEANGS